MESTGFKEWAAVCQALGRGRQSIIVRKGGIAEGRDGFSFKHGEFFLFPTCFHEQSTKVREGDFELLENDPTKVTISFWAKLEVSRTVKSWEIAEALESFHILQPDVVRERFAYDEAPGLHVAFVRVFRLVPGWTFPNEKRYAGCRSWVNLPEPPASLRFEPVLNDAKHEQRRTEFVRIAMEGAAPSAPGK